MRVYSGASKCKYTTSKLSLVYQCTSCDSFTLQPLGIVKMTEKQPKFRLPTGPPITKQCIHCGGSHHVIFLTEL